MLETLCSGKPSYKILLYRSSHPTELNGLILSPDVVDTLNLGPFDISTLHTLLTVNAYKPL